MSLREYSEAVQNASPNNEDYIVVNEEIDPKYQIMAVVDRFERSRKSPIILFKMFAEVSFRVWLMSVPPEKG